MFIVYRIIRTFCHWKRLSRIGSLSFVRLAWVISHFLYLLVSLIGDNQEQRLINYYSNVDWTCQNPFFLNNQVYIYFCIVYNKMIEIIIIMKTLKDKSYWYIVDICVSIIKYSPRHEDSYSVYELIRFFKEYSSVEWFFYWWRCYRFNLCS